VRVKGVIETPTGYLVAYGDTNRSVMTRLASAGGTSLRVRSSRFTLLVPSKFPISAVQGWTFLSVFAIV
jgi:hypothetical protein